MNNEEESKKASVIKINQCGAGKLMTGQWTHRGEYSQHAFNVNNVYSLPHISSDSSACRKKLNRVECGYQFDDSRFIIYIGCFYIINNGYTVQHFHS